MMKFLSCTKTAIVFLIVTLVSLGSYTYMLARPISYGMEYYNETVYDGEAFEGTMVFHSDNSMTIKNINFDEEMESRFYYKEGYVFLTMAETDEEYEEEVSYIDANFEEAVKSPFYASEINSFRMIAEGGDGYTVVYTCKSAIVFAAVGGAVELVLLGLAIVSLILSQKAKSRE